MIMIITTIIRRRSDTVLLKRSWPASHVCTLPTQGGAIFPALSMSLYLDHISFSSLSMPLKLKYHTLLILDHHVDAY